MLVRGGYGAGLGPCDLTGVSVLRAPVVVQPPPVVVEPSPRCVVQPLRRLSSFQPQAPQVYVQRGSRGSHFYYCESVKAYYPKSGVPTGWTRVAPQPSAGRRSSQTCWRVGRGRERRSNTRARSESADANGRMMKVTNDGTGTHVTMVVR